jgi:nucleoside-diphosphate-sugar epimerase
VPQASKRPTDDGLTVAVTGPTGGIGLALVDALERTKAVKRIVGMARSAFDPAERGWKKTEYLKGNVLDRDAVDQLVKGADVVVHLAFIIIGDHDESRKVNLEGSRNVFEAAIASRACKRLVYTSSVAAYGFHEDNPSPLTEDVEPRGTDRFYYSAQKAELEATLAELMKGKRATQAYVFRPCIVSGPDALLLVENLVPLTPGAKLPGPLASIFDALPLLKPVIVDPGVPMQLVHQDDVASALKAAVLGKGEPGVYNLAADDVLTMSQVADELGWYSVTLPEVAVEVAAELVARIPFAPPEARWVEAFRIPVTMSSEKAKKQLGWRPQHDAVDTLRETIVSARDRGLLR